MERHDRLDLLDSRFILYGYALVVGPVGLVASTNLGDQWAHQWVPIDYLTRVISLLRVGGMMACGAAITAIAIGLLGDPRERQRSLGWFAAAHTLVLLMLWGQVHAIWDYAPPLNTVLVCFVMAWGWLAGGWLRGIRGRPRPINTLGLDDGARPIATPTAYEQHIRQIAAQEERSRLARDLHDSIKQQIFAIQTAAATAETRLDGDQDGARQSLAQVRDAARDASAEMEALLDQLRVTPLENASLIEALTRQAEALRLRSGADVTCTIDALPPEAALPPGAHMALFRAAQEALSNVARHARPSKVRVRLVNSPGRLELTIRDDGSGFDQTSTQRGMGLANIRTRLAEIGGRSTVVSREGEGTTVTLEVPYRKDVPQALLSHAVALGVTLAAIILTWASDASKFYLAVPAVFVAVDGLHYLVRWRRARSLTGRLA